MPLMCHIEIDTDLFEHREVKPHFINPCCFGEDFAAWIKRELSQLGDPNLELSGPTQEDYGWGVSAWRGKNRYWVTVSCESGRSEEPRAHWVISVASDPGLGLTQRLFRKADRDGFELLRAQVLTILRSNPRIQSLQMTE